VGQVLRRRVNLYCINLTQSSRCALTAVFSTNVPHPVTFQRRGQLQSEASSSSIQHQSQLTQSNAGGKCSGAFQFQQPNVTNMLALASSDNVGTLLPKNKIEVSTVVGVETCVAAATCLTAPTLPPHTPPMPPPPLQVQQHLAARDRQGTGKQMLHAALHGCIVPDYSVEAFHRQRPSRRSSTILERTGGVSAALHHAPPPPPLPSIPRTISRIFGGSEWLRDVTRPLNQSSSSGAAELSPVLSSSRSWKTDLYKPLEGLGSGAYDALRQVSARQHFRERSLEGKGVKAVLGAVDEVPDEPRVRRKPNEYHRSGVAMRGLLQHEQAGDGAAGMRTGIAAPSGMQLRFISNISRQLSLSQAACLQGCAPREMGAGTCCV
jgi:hypothetical protein